MASFTEYGIDMQRRLLPMVETAEVANIQREGDGFTVSLGNGTRFRARKVISAVGPTYFPNVPAPPDKLPRYFVSHTSHHSNYDGRAGKEVVLHRRRQSALEAAAP